MTEENGQSPTPEAPAELPGRRAAEAQGDGGATAPRGGRNRAGLVLGGALLLALLAVSAQWVWYRLTHISTEAAYVKADMAEVAPEVPGRVLKVAVKDGDAVKAGQVLVEIEDTDLRQRERQTQAGVVSAEVQVVRGQAVLDQTRGRVAAGTSAAEAGLEATRQLLIKAQANQCFAEAQDRRFSALLDQQAVPRSRWEEVHLGAEAARADLAAARQGVIASEARLAEARAAELSVAEADAGLGVSRAAVDQARAALAQVEWARGRAEVRAPIDGVVARVFVRVGDSALPGRPVAALYDPATRYVEARFEETRLQHVANGKAVTVFVDALPGLALAGRVRRVAPAAAQEFALIPRDVTAGEFTKVMQRVSVEIEIDDLEHHPEIVPGLSTEVVLARGRRP
jgi:membrane fusion protein, multidrug efflux system